MSQHQYQSILPNFDVFTPRGPVRNPPGGQMLGVTPRRAASFMLNPGMAAMRGLGEDAPAAPPAPVMPGAPAADKEKIPGWLAVTVIGAVGFLSYEIGSAMAPSGGKKTTWGLWGIPVGLFTGPLGLGAMAILSNHTTVGRRG